MATIRLIARGRAAVARREAHVRRVRQMAQLRSIIARRRNEKYKNALRFGRPQTFLLVDFVGSECRTELFKAETFVEARDHGRRCTPNAKLFWTSHAEGLIGLRDLAKARGVAIDLGQRRPHGGQHGTRLSSGEPKPKPSEFAAVAPPSL